MIRCLLCVDCCVPVVVFLFLDCRCLRAAFFVCLLFVVVCRMCLFVVVCSPLLVVYYLSWFVFWLLLFFACWCLLDGCLVLV